jgi:AcrR family transcriptional regulator
MAENTPDKKQIILDASEKLFSSKSFDGTSTREIAEAADVNVAMISYYFGSKENLLKAIIDRHASAILALMEAEVGKNVEPRNKMENILQAYLNYSLAHPAPSVISRREMGVNTRPILKDSLQFVYKQVKDILIKTIREGQERGDFREFDIDLFMFAIGGIVENITGELHSMEINGLNPEAFGLSPISDPNFRERFFRFFWDLTSSYINKPST